MDKIDQLGYAGLVFIILSFLASILENHKLSNLSMIAGIFMIVLMNGYKIDKLEEFCEKVYDFMDLEDNSISSTTEVEK